MVVKEESSNLLSTYPSPTTWQQGTKYLEEPVCEPNNTNMGGRGQSESIPAIVGWTLDQITFALPNPPLPPPPPLHAHAPTHIYISVTKVFLMA